MASRTWRRRQIAISYSVCAWPEQKICFRYAVVVAPVVVLKVSIAKATTDKEKSPSKSRDLNHNCAWLSFSMIMICGILKVIMVHDRTENLKIKRDLPVSWSLIGILSVTKHWGITCPPFLSPHPYFDWEFLHCTHGKCFKNWVRAGAMVTDRITIKLQLTGKSRLIFKF